jgi:hypothetical protein
MSKFKNPINEVGVTEVYGIDEPKILVSGTSLSFVGEGEMTPAEFVGQLEGMERKIFSKLYAGKMAEKLYKLYEYRK